MTDHDPSVDTPASAPSAESGTEGQGQPATPAARKRRAPRRTQPQVEDAAQTDAGAQAAPSDGPRAASDGPRADEARVETSARASEGDAVFAPSGGGDATTQPNAPTAGPSNAPAAEGGERRRRRRNKHGRSPHPEGARRDGEASAGPEQAPQALIVDPRSLEVFDLVTSEGFDESVTATDEELRELEARAEREPAADADGVAPSDDASGDDRPAAMPVDPDAASDALSGSDSTAPDADPESGTDAGRPRRVLSPERDAPKLQKVLAQSGAGSRRDIEQWISQGRVSVNGTPAHTGQRVSHGDRVAIDGKPIRIRIAPLAPRVIAYHKPVGEIVTHDDPQQRPTVFRKLPRLEHGKWQSVGRLDINTEGLLLFTNSGELANQLMHPRFGVQREYAVRVLGALDDDARATLLSGVDIDGQRAAFLAIDAGSGDGANRWYRVTISEGRNREVRRLFDAVGLAVSRLIRIRYGAVVLPRGLKRGVWVDLPSADVQALHRMLGMPRSDDAGQGRGGGKGKRRGKGGGRGQQGANAGEGAYDNNRGPKRGPQHGHGQSQHGPHTGQQPRQPDPRGQGQGQGQGRSRGAGPRHPNEPFGYPNQGPQGRGGNAGSQGRGNHRDRPNSNPRPPREDGAIPNPLQQTYDKRAIVEARMQRREVREDGPIPNPLQQTYDKRAMREANRVPARDYGDDGPIPNPLQQTYDKRLIQGQGRDALDLGHKARRSQGAANGQPDPMRTSVGYIGSDALRLKQQRGRSGGGGGGRGGGGGGSGGGGRAGGGGGPRGRGPRGGR